MRLSPADVRLAAHVTAWRDLLSFLTCPVVVAAPEPATVWAQILVPHRRRGRCGRLLSVKGSRTVLRMLEANVDERGPGAAPWGSAPSAGALLSFPWPIMGPRAEGMHSGETWACWDAGP